MIYYQQTSGIENTSKNLRLIYQSDQPYEKLLELGNDVSIHQLHLQF